MRDFKCIACRTRTRHAVDVAGDPCPSCASPLEAVGDLAEAVGFRLVMRADPAAGEVAPLGDFTAHRNAVYAQRVRDALDADRWKDDGGDAVAAVALPTPSTGNTTPCRPGPR